MVYTLYCAIQGAGSNFTIKVKGSKMTVGELRAVIKEENPNSLASVDKAELILWKVRMVPHQPHGIASETFLCSHQLKRPIVAKTKRELVAAIANLPRDLAQVADEIDGLAAEPINSYFPNVEAAAVHLVVGAPITPACKWFQVIKSI